jgi:hypothetical protein
MTVVSELNLYFHMPGQILRTNNHNRLSLSNRENVKLNDEWSHKVELNTDWDISLNIETVDFSELRKPDCLEYQKSYDQCIKSQFLQKGNNSAFSELFLYDVNQWSPSLQMVPIKVIQEYFATIMSPNAIGQCSNSCSYIQVQFDQKPTREHLKTHFKVKTKFVAVQLGQSLDLGSNTDLHLQ